MSEIKMKDRLDKTELTGFGTEITTVELKDRLLNSMIERNLFWSYDKNSAREATDSQTIQTIMLYGDVDQLMTLLSLYSRERLKAEWMQLFSRDTLYKREGEFIASYLFGEKVRL
jgi:hypothetical protein